MPNRLKVLSQGILLSFMQILPDDSSMTIFSCILQFLIPVKIFWQSEVALLVCFFLANSCYNVNLFSASLFANGVIVFVGVLVIL